MDGKLSSYEAILSRNQPRDRKTFCVKVTFFGGVTLGANITNNTKLAGVTKDAIVILLRTLRNSERMHW
jgi:hypothetical protein